MKRVKNRSTVMSADVLLHWRGDLACLTRRNRISHKLQVVLYLKMCVSLQFHHHLLSLFLPKPVSCGRSVFGHAWMSIIHGRNEMCKWTFLPSRNGGDAGAPISTES